MGETFTIALAILNCHGIRDLPNNIQRKHKDVLTLDYMGLKFKVASENADKVSCFIKDFMFFYRQYQFNGGIEYDSLPIYKIVETISREFKNRVNALIKPVPTRQSFIETRVLGSEVVQFESRKPQFPGRGSEMLALRDLRASQNGERHPHSPWRGLENTDLPCNRARYIAKIQAQHAIHSRCIRRQTSGVRSVRDGTAHVQKHISHGKLHRVV